MYGFAIRIRSNDDGRTRDRVYDVWRRDEHAKIVVVNWWAICTTIIFQVWPSNNVDLGFFERPERLEEQESQKWRFYRARRTKKPNLCCHFPVFVRYKFGPSATGYAGSVILSSSIFFFITHSTYGLTLFFFGAFDFVLCITLNILIIFLPRFRANRFACKLFNLHAILFLLIFTFCLKKIVTMLIRKIIIRKNVK